MADAPALDLRWRPGADAITLCEILYAALDGFAPLAIHEHETADGWRVFFRTDELRERVSDMKAAEATRAEARRASVRFASAESSSRPPGTMRPSQRRTQSAMRPLAAL